MHSLKWQKHSEQQASIIGHLTRDTVPNLWRQLESWRPASPAFNLDLNQVERVDSAGMVLLIHLIEHAKSKNCHIMLSSIPKELTTLFKLSNVDTMLNEHIQLTEK